ncbi:MAG TPA: cytochrome c oxidase assembly protein [Dehalococcoidia bacterium]|nr:cytochrome c oxidase assembly protein [Dehalococcoidia bacterium]
MGIENIGGYEWLDWHLHAEVLLLCAVLLAGYFYVITELRPRISDAGRVPQGQIIAYCLGVLTIYVAAGSPVHDLSEEYLLSMHMFQHLLITLVAPPLLLAGIPAWVWQALLRRRGMMPVAKFLVAPLVAFGVFNLLIVITHLPHVVDYALEEHWFHFVVHAALLTSGMMMWWPVMSNVPELPRLSYPLQMAYLFVQSLLPAVIGSFITFSQTAVYDFYGDAPRIWGLDPVEDQQIGALVMKLVGSLILWAFIGVAFFRWYESEQSESKGPGWRDVEDELKEMGLTQPH